MERPGAGRSAAAYCLDTLVYIRKHLRFQTLAAAILLPLAIARTHIEESLLWVACHPAALCARKHCVLVKYSTNLMSLSILRVFYAERLPSLLLYIAYIIKKAALYFDVYQMSI